ncbi:unnamed protein product [Spodoptera littoralis]|uniref:EGF-like domain-containing protein n=1 Tax=Spodoptera littoralis TaxID=7109 RepID=A0A9P0IFM8_SPOLI|nr:unnamed protein product [Spodoptera littoralis]CAH1645977.1 unnamed protein product [Spodoptera littoralis]
MLQNCLALIFCGTAVFLIVAVQSELCKKTRPETYLTTDKISYSYVTYENGIIRSHIKIKTITKMAYRAREILDPCDSTWKADFLLRIRIRKRACNKQCINGQCDLSGNCVCYSGYAEQNGTCVPVCDRCSYGTCIAPGTCRCDLGYEVNAKGECTPKSNTSDCFPGYTAVNNTCEPYCSNGCPDGFCAAPETCFCLDGFREDKDENGTNVCSPICSTLCGPGLCVAPEVCKCFEGYKADYVDNFSVQCMPVCKDCEGICIAPYKCVAKEPPNFSEPNNKTSAGTTRTTTESTSTTHLSSIASVYPILERNKTIEPFAENYNKSKTIHEEFLRKSQNQQDGVSVLISIIIGRNNCGKYNISVSDGQGKN